MRKTLVMVLRQLIAQKIFWNYLLRELSIASFIIHNHNHNQSLQYFFRKIFAIFSPQNVCIYFLDFSIFAEFLHFFAKQIKIKFREKSEHFRIFLKQTKCK